MLWTVFVVLLVLWLLGVVSSHLLGGFVHLLLALAVAALIVQLLMNRHDVA
ncbi:MAG: lmo0937 family membrane protein [Terriglobales bacterium]